MDTFRQPSDTRNFKSMVGPNLLIVNSDHNKSIQDHIGPKTDRNGTYVAGKRGRVIDQRSNSNTVDSFRWNKPASSSWHTSSNLKDNQQQHTFRMKRSRSPTDTVKLPTASASMEQDEFGLTSPSQFTTQAISTSRALYSSIAKLSNLGCGRM